ncbi:predicted protein, partial [Nematostella vectensis]
MEKIFHYLAALFSRFLFLIHAVLMICWLVLVKDNNLYFIFVSLLVALVIETFITVGFRKGHEYAGFCPSMFLYLLAVIPCDWITKRAVINFFHIFQALGSVYKSQDDEAVLYTLEQALVLILVIGRWLLPKGSISRDQLSQLLLVYVGMAADIMEFTEIIKEDEIRKVNMLNNNHFVNAVILFWSMSLFQFTLTISGTERTAQLNEYIELVSLLVPMLMQDGPFLIIRLIAIAYYEVNHDTLYFLTVKNALVIMLQIYRIFVLY